MNSITNGIDVKNIKNKVKVNPTQQYKVFLGILIPILLIFCFSNLFLPDARKNLSTEIGSKQSLGASSTVKLCNWEYNSQNNMMEVVIRIDNKSSNFHKEYDISAITSGKGNRKLNTELVYYEDDVLIVNINKLPKANSWKSVKLSILEVEDRVSDSSNSGYLQNQAVDLICDYRTIARNDSLETKSENEYISIAMTVLIERVEEDKASISDKIQLAESQILALQNDIKSIESNKQYQTETEKKESTGTQKSKEGDINRLNRDIEEFNRSIAELDTKINKYQEKLKAVN